MIKEGDHMMKRKETKRKGRKGNKRGLEEREGKGRGKGKLSVGCVGGKIRKRGKETREKNERKCAK